MEKWPQDLVIKFWSNVISVGDCWEWVGYRDANGYGRFYVPGISGSRGKQVMTHRAAYWLSTGEWPLVVRHACDNPPCLRHLLPGTHQDNVNDKIARGKQRGNPRRFTEEQEKAIEQEYRAGKLSQRGLAEKYGTHQGQISRILKRRGASGVWGVWPRVNQRDSE